MIVFVEMKKGDLLSWYCSRDATASKKYSVKQSICSYSTYM